MQGGNWQDLRLFLTLLRAGSFAEAARQAGLHETTLARRIARLEAVRGQRLWLPHPGGGAPTAEGQALLPALEAAEAALVPVPAAEGQATGRVRLSMVPWLIAVFARHLNGLEALYPGLALDLEAEQAARDPLRGEVDLALRFAPPGTDSEVIGRRLCDVPFGAFARKGAEGAPWIGYTEAYAHLPQARWHGAESERHRIGDLASAAQLVAAGIGPAYLPLAIAPGGAARLPGAGVRPLWLLYHPRQREAPALRAVIGWIEAEIVPALMGGADGGHAEGMLDG